jgi:murein DD-endopeptidase MepM/ murein hydrolase activator NlpD
MTTAVSHLPKAYSQHLLEGTRKSGNQTARGKAGLSSLEAQRLEDACAEFESLFINLVMKQMRKTVTKSGLIDGGMGEEIFTGMMDEEIAKQMSSRQGLGLRSALMEQLTGVRGSTIPRNIALKNYRTNNPVTTSGQTFALPVSGTVSSPYGWRKDPFSGERTFHYGLDIASPAGSGIFAAGKGRVVFSGWKKGYGNVVEIEHGDGFSTLYAHNEKNLVKEGEEVSHYQLIALVGDTGKSTGPHLHYEVKKNGKVVNPTKVTQLSEGGWYASSL